MEEWWWSRDGGKRRCTRRGQEVVRSEEWGVEEGNSTNTRDRDKTE